jgi:hypothetical protein
MTDFNWIQGLFNGGFMVVVGGGLIFMFKGWMKTREANESEIRINSTIQAEKIAKEFQERHEKSCIEIKQQIAENKAYYKETYSDLKKDIGGIADLQRIANGRTTKLELRFATLEQAHKDRVCEQ